VVFDPLNDVQSFTIKLSLYYTGLKGKVG